MKTWQAMLIGVVAVGLIVGSIVWEVDVWRECRAHGHSWWYCARVLSR